MAILILNRGPITLRPYHEWLADHPGELLLLSSAEHLGAPPVPTWHYAHAEIITDYDRSDRVLATALELADRYDVTHVIACHELDLQRAAALRERLGLPGQGVASATAYRDKLRMKQLAVAAGLPVAPHTLVTHPRDVQRLVSQHGYPIVVKPRDGLSSIGLHVLHDERELAAWQAEAFAGGAPHRLLAEAFVPGDMFHVDGFIEDGRVRVAWPSQYLYRLAAFADERPRLDVTVPPGPLATRLTTFATAVVAALPTPHCSTFHAEIFRTPDDRLVLCEIASRNGGALIKGLLKAMYRVDFPSAWVRRSVGLPVPELAAVDRPRRMAAQVLLPGRAGRVGRVPTRPDLDGLESFEVFVHPGQVLAGAASSGDYLAGLVVSGRDAAERDVRMRSAAAWLAGAVEVDPAPPSSEQTAGGADRVHVVLLDRSGYDLFRGPDGRPFLDPARYRVTLITPPEKIGQVRPGEVDTVLAVDVLSEAAVLAVLPVLQSGPRVDHVAAVGERLLVLAARFRAALGLPGFTVAQVETLRDKVAMKAHMAAAGVRVPEFAPIVRPLDAADLLAEHGTIILKPRAGMGSVGVHKVSSMAHLLDLDAGWQSSHGAYEAERYVFGDMFHIDSVVVAGEPVVGVPSRYLDSNEYFPFGGQNRTVVVEAGPLCAALVAMNRQVLAALPWFSGVTHLEVFVGADGIPVFCEIAGRPGGGGIVPAFRHRFGVDLTLLTLLPQLGCPLPAPREIQPPERRCYGTAVFYPPAAGRLTAFDPMPARDWIVQFTPLRHVGQQLQQPVSVGQGVAEVTVIGPDAATVRRHLDEVQSVLSVTVEPAADRAAA